MISTDTLIHQGILLLNNRYIVAVLFFLGFFLISKIIVFLAERVILRLTIKTKTDIDDLMITRTNRPISIMIVFIGLRLAIHALDLHDGVIDISNKIVLSAILVLFSYIIVIVIDILIQEWGRKWASKTESSLDDHLISLLQRSIKIVYFVIASLLVLTAWGVQIGPLLASLGIVGIAVAFALQNTLGNVFGGLSLIFDRSIKVGDVIKLDNETMGTVKDVGLRSTKIATFDNELIFVPNGQLANQKFQNFVLPEPKVRVTVPFTVAYGTSVKKVKKVVMKEITSMKECMKEPEPMVRFMQMGDSALMFTAFFWVDSFTKRFDAKEQANTLIYNAMNKNKISIPFPQMDVHLKRR